MTDIFSTSIRNPRRENGPEWGLHITDIHPETAHICNPNLQLVGRVSVAEIISTGMVTIETENPPISVELEPTLVDDISTHVGRLAVSR